MPKRTYTKTCLYCNSEFMTVDKRQKFCSRECANSIMRHQGYCIRCGNPIMKRNSYRIKYCSDECRIADHKEKYPPKAKEVIMHTKVCAWCSKEFQTKFSQRIYCSDECSYNANLKTKRDQWKENYIPKKVVCKECGSEFITECGNMHSVFCCNKCADAYKKQQERKTQRHKDSLREQKKRREQQIKQCYVENVSYELLYKRDCGICQICGMPVHSEKLCDNNWDGTIDHIIPLSLGGEHSISNCQLAHRICNSVKQTETNNFTINWYEKSKENNYWSQKFEAYLKLMNLKGNCPPMNLYEPVVTRPRPPFV